MTTPSERYRCAAFLDSVAHTRGLPPDTGREVAFAGRSNAGKSSAINRLTGRRALARTSNTPGRTQLINLFDLGDDRRLVDLPGYGYARVPHATRERWQALVADYLAGREALAGTVLLVDSRRGLGDRDRAFIDWLLAAECPLHVVLTKADKLKRNEAARTLEQSRRGLEDGGVEATLQLFSATTGSGLEDLHGVLDDWLFTAAVAS